jgi:hypothetical protein
MLAKKESNMRAESPEFPIEKEPKIPTLDRPLIIESAFPGWLPPRVNPNIPLNPRAISREIIDSVREGAGAIHVHPRDPVDGALLMDPHKLKELIDPVFDACGEVFTWNHTWVGEVMKPITYVDHTEEVLNLGNGNKYCMGSVVLITGNSNARNQTLWGDAQAVKEGVPYLEKNGVKPIFRFMIPTESNGSPTRLSKRGLPNGSHSCVACTWASITLPISARTRGLIISF